jgi:hypothetical protein
METPATRAANPNRPNAEHVRNTSAGTGGGVLGKLFGVRACLSVLLQAPTELYAGASSCPGRFPSLFPGPWAVNLDCRSFPAAHQVMLHVCDSGSWHHEETQTA